VLVTTTLDNAKSKPEVRVPTKGSRLPGNTEINMLGNGKKQITGEVFSMPLSPQRIGKQVDVAYPEAEHMVISEIQNITGAGQSHYLGTGLRKAFRQGSLFMTFFPPKANCKPLSQWLSRVLERHNLADRKSAIFLILPSNWFQSKTPSPFAIE
jgi:hypothetical protein